MKSKRSLLTIVIALGLAAGLCAQTPAPAPADAAAPAAPAAPKLSETQLLEVFGWFVGKQNGLEELGFSEEQVTVLARGMQLARSGAQAPVALEEAGPQLQEFLVARQEVYLAKEKAKNMAIFETLKGKPGVVFLDSGVAYEIIQPGDGAYPTPQDTVKVHYTGTLIDGTKFDSSRDHPGAEPSEFVLSDVIPGWTEGMQKISKGGKIKLYIPAEQGYGAQPRQGSGIPPNATLIFEVELLDVTPPAPAPAPAPAAPAAPAAATPVAE
ncbi:MAG: FKBP-type peptidyl-prolyl cis-trans isomerase [Opitutaceae bacterium]|jgi:FKBP-type peptidyl-prolyl cis-trans isomerase|nr:FKBP-type peptidyl-prolyl cis-trans isomerase [Opitutaceae bacterium]